MADTAIPTLFGQATKLVVLLAHVNITKQKLEIERMACEMELKQLKVKKLKLELRIKELSQEVCNKKI